MEHLKFIDNFNREPEDVYFYIYPPTFSADWAPYIFDNEYYYFSKDGTLANHVRQNIERDNIELKIILENKGNEIYLNKEYHLLAYWDPYIAAHNYHSIIVYLYMYNLWNKENINYLIAKSEDKYYNNLIDFLKNNFLLNCNFEQLEAGKLYKIKKLNLLKTLDMHPKKQEGSDRFPHDLAYEEYSNILKNKFLDNNKQKIKTFNIKFDTNNQFCISKDRSYTFNKSIHDILAKHGYQELNTNTELEKQIQLQNSSHFICSWGGNSHINIEICSYNSGRTFNSGKKCLVLCHELYEHEWERFFRDHGQPGSNIVEIGYGHNRTRMIKNVNFDHLDQIITEFENDFN